jgi:signal transduction histidine kinase
MFKPFTNRHRGESQPAFDRIRVFAAVVLVMASIIAYAWIALDADKVARAQLDLDRNLGVAQLAARLLDEQCEKIVAVLEQLARQPEFASDLRNGRTQNVRQGLAGPLKSVVEITSISAYRSDGALVSRTPPFRGPTPPVANPSWLRRLRTGDSRYAAHLARSDRRDELLLAVPVRSGVIGLGYLVAACPSRVIEEKLDRVRSGAGALYVADSDGRILAANGPSWHRNILLDSYPPMRYAINGQQGSLEGDGPDGQDACLVGYAYASIPRCGVVSVQPIGSGRSPADYLMQRLSLLLIPLLMLVTAWAWQRVRSERRIGAMAHQLAEQNAALRAADRAKSDFLANVSHDLRTPLAAMRISISGLLDPGAKWTRPHAQETLEVVSEEIDQISARVRNLLDMARLEAGVDEIERDPRDLTDIVGAVLERMRALTRGRAIHADFPAEPLMAECDQTQIESVLVNLIENAVKYSPEGSPLHLQGSRRGATITLRIWDDGPGLQAGDEERVFEKFYRSKRTRTVRGTGLGLSICRAIIEGHGGQIGARRAPGGGAEFWFTLQTMPDLGHARARTSAEGAHA